LNGKNARGSVKRITLQHVGYSMVDQRRSVKRKGRNVTSLQTFSTGTGLEVERPMKSPVVKRSIVIAGHKTSVSLEDAFWKGLKEIADERSVTLSDIVASIDSQRRHGNLSSAIRLFVLDHYRSLSEDKNGHGDGMLRSSNVP